MKRKLDAITLMLKQMFILLYCNSSAIIFANQSIRKLHKEKMASYFILYLVVILQQAKIASECTNSAI